MITTAFVSWGTKQDPSRKNVACGGLIENSLIKRKSVQLYKNPCLSLQLEGPIFGEWMLVVLCHDRVTRTG